jgi:hypothetical protein
VLMVCILLPFAAATFRYRVDADWAIDTIELGLRVSKLENLAV